MPVSFVANSLASLAEAHSQSQQSVPRSHMRWSVQQTRRFARQYKKLHNNTAIDVDAAVDELAQDPEIGERKKGDLTALRVVKFRSAWRLFLLGYALDEGVRLVYLEADSPHENFYRDLKR